MKISIFFSFLMVLILVAGLFASCGDDDDDDPSAGSGQTTEDDDDAVDDDMTDDDAADDDATDDDMTDDDAADDDATDDDATDDDAADDDDATGDFPLFIDFEDYSLGPLPANWQNSFSGATSAQIATFSGKGPSGKAIEFTGGTAPADSGGLWYAFQSETGFDFTFSFDVWRAASSSIYFYIWGNSGGIQAASFYFQAGDGLTAYDFAKSSVVSCGTIPPLTSTAVAVSFHSPNTYDVTLNGAPTPCTGLQSNDSAITRIDNFEMRDGISNGEGGQFFFDNFAAHE